MSSLEALFCHVDDGCRVFEPKLEHLPPPGGKYYQRPSSNNEVSMDQVMKKLDKLFARLDDMNSSSPEQVTSELLMFISSGIFVLFMMDLLVKKGSKLRF